MPTTEVLFAPLKPGSIPEAHLEPVRDLSTVGNISLGYVVDEPNTLLALIGISQRTHQTTSITNILGLVDWDSIEAHEAFNASDAYGPFMKGIHSIVAGRPSLWHVDFRPSLEAQHKVCGSRSARLGGISVHLASLELGGTPSESASRGLAISSR